MLNSYNLNHFRMNGRVKSVGDLLDSRSLSEHADFYLDDVPGRTSRPKSMYEGSNLRLVNGTNQVCISFL